MGRGGRGGWRLVVVFVLLKGFAAGFCTLEEGLWDGVASTQGVVDDRVEVDEPALEECLCHRFERGIHLTVQLDLVIQGTQDVSNAFLLGEGREWDFN
jgi:hypothetical protein